jgi:hypothetical protein
MVCLIVSSSASRSSSQCFSGLTPSTPLPVKLFKPRETTECSIDNSLSVVKSSMPNRSGLFARRFNMELICQHSSPAHIIQNIVHFVMGTNSFCSCT